PPLPLRCDESSAAAPAAAPSTTTVPAIRARLFPSMYLPPRIRATFGAATYGHLPGPAMRPISTTRRHTGIRRVSRGHHAALPLDGLHTPHVRLDRKSTRLNS